MIVWHYTTGANLASILSDGYIEVAREGLPLGELGAAFVAQLQEIQATGVTREIEIPFAESPAVWFSRRLTYEPTAVKGWVEHGIRRSMTVQEMIDYPGGGGIARIGVSVTGLYSWVEHRRLSGVSPKRASDLVRAGRAMGANPGDWFVHYGRVPAERWEAVQTSPDNREWIDVPRVRDGRAA